MMGGKRNHKDTSKLLWRDSPCTLRCVLQNPSMDNAQRFHYGSIYYKDDVNRPKKVFTEFEKPELLLLNFRRQLEEVNIRARKISGGKNNLSAMPREWRQSKKVTSPLDVKLYQRPSRIQLRHDRHGNRSSYHGECEARQITERMKDSKSSFYSSLRMDLSRPENFYPGPGTYFNERPQLRGRPERRDPTALQNRTGQREKARRHTFTERMNSFSQNQA